MKKSWKYGLIGAAAALAAVLLPYEIDRNDDGEFSYNSLLLGVYRRKRSDGEHATAVTLFNAPALTDESRKAREAAVRHVIEAAAEQELFADEDDPTEGAASAPAAAAAGSCTASPAGRRRMAGACAGTWRSSLRKSKTGRSIGTTSPCSAIRRNTVWEYAPCIRGT